MQNLVSVVIPCLNHSAFLLEAINSVLNSTYPHIEIIIVDDGSTDNSGEVAREVMSRHENVFYVYQHNQGPSIARNRGIQEAKGEYILPLDADDKISNQYIEQAFEVLKNDQGIKVVFCKAEFFGRKTGLWKLKEFSLKKLATDNMIFSCAMFRKEDWKNVGGYSTELIGGWEDWEFWISMLKNGGHVHRLDFIGFYYRIHQYSRRKSTTKEIKRLTIDFINRKHRDFMYTQLKGPLRIKRKHSLLINFLSHIFSSAISKRKVSNYRLYQELFNNKCGIEIGGPSVLFETKVPIYNTIKSLDGVNFSSSTIWEGALLEGENYRYGDGKIGHQFICDAVNLFKVESEKYDFILSCNNLEHIANTIKALTEWLRIIKSGGLLLLVLPNKNSNFDHNRRITSIEHLLEDFKNNITEEDLTHLDEIITLHDLSKDHQAGDLENFKKRSVNNFQNRCLHHHVFDLNLLEQIFKYFNIELLLTDSTKKNYIIVGRKM